MLPAVLFLFRLFQFDLKSLGNRNAARAYHGHLAVYKQRPVASVHIVIGGNAVYNLDVKPVFAVVAGDQPQRQKRIGSTDEKYLRRAEGLLFGELAVALEIPLDDVPAFIENRLGSLAAAME